MKIETETKKLLLAIAIGVLLGVIYWQVQVIKRELAKPSIFPITEAFVIYPDGKLKTLP